MAQLTNAEIDTALARGEAAQREEPRVIHVHYDYKIDRVIIELTNGCTFAFPPRLAQGLETATADQISQIEVIGSGYGLHWDQLDVDLSVPGLLNGLLGNRAHMARRAGQVKSEAKATAARINGSKGGRPRKPSASDRVSAPSAETIVAVFDTAAAADAAIAGLRAGKPIWTKPVKDNKGNVVLPNAPYDNYAEPLNSMTYLVEGVMGSTT